MDMIWTHRCQGHPRVLNHTPLAFMDRPQSCHPRPSRSLLDKHPPTVQRSDPPATLILLIATAFTSLASTRALTRARTRVIPTHLQRLVFAVKGGKKKGTLPSLLVYPSTHPLFFFFFCGILLHVFYLYHIPHLFVFLCGFPLFFAFAFRFLFVVLRLCVETATCICTHLSPLYQIFTIKQLKLSLSLSLSLSYLILSWYSKKKKGIHRTEKKHASCRLLNTVDLDPCTNHGLRYVLLGFLAHAVAWSRSRAPNEWPKSSFVSPKSLFKH